MTKKIIALAMVMTVCSAALFAQEKEQAKKPGLFSIGAGALFTSDFGGGAMGYELENGGDTASFKTSYAGGGGFIFVDATYAELSLSIWGGGGEINMDDSLASFLGNIDGNEFKVSGLNIGILGKYPIALNAKMSVFPMVGIDYMIMLSAKDKDDKAMKNTKGDEIASDLSALWIKFGGGLDYKLNSNLYIRGEVLYGIRLENTGEKDMVSFWEDLGKTMGADISGKSLLGHGLTIKAAVGYAF